MKKFIKNAVVYIKTFALWLSVALAVGLVGGSVGVLFHFAVDYVTELRLHHGFLILLLPLGGVLIAGMYRLFKAEGPIDTNRVIESVRKHKKVPLVMVPLIFVSTVITHLFGGSAGREGAALQIGGGIGYNMAKVLRLQERDMRIMTMAGMSSVFVALFGTPVTAAVFALEVIRVGVFNYVGIFACLLSAAVGYMLSILAGISPLHFEIVTEAVSAGGILKVIGLSACCGFLSVLFCLAIKYSHQGLKKGIPNRYLRAFAGGLLVVLLTFLVGSQKYNGAGMETIVLAVNGKADVQDFVLKILVTAITIGAGFKGGEIIPTLFIGSTFGCAVAPVFGLDPGFGAAIGMIALFCGMVNCPIASLVLAVELFGAEGLLLFGIACAVSYIFSGYSGLYSGQKIVYAKLGGHKIDVHTKS